MVDNLFLLAVAAFGLGLSLATYRFIALRQGWPMGAFHADMPWLPLLIGLASLLLAVLFAAARGTAAGGWVIILFGTLLAIFWTGFLRVGSQISLFLAPAAAVLLIMSWLAVPLGGTAFERTGWTRGEPGRYVGGTYYDNRYSGDSSGTAR